MDLKMKCQIGFGFEKPKSVHLWGLVLCLGGKVHQSPPRGDGTEQTVDKS